MTDVETAVTVPQVITTSSTELLPKEPIKINSNATATTSSRVNVNNVLNLVGFFLSLSISYVGGVAGWFGGNTNIEVYNKYITLITPSNFYYGKCSKRSQHCMHF
jgi:hypothetical protein